MSKTGEYTLDWLQSGGYDLGYSEYDLPKMDDMNYVLDHKIKVWEYKGMTEEEYYG
jgi:hypothetical protein